MFQRRDSLCLDLPVRQNEGAFGVLLLVIGECHPQIGPPHPRAHADEPLICRLIVALNAQRDAARSAPPSEVAQRSRHLAELFLVEENELEHPQLLARPALDKRYGVRERESLERAVGAAQNHRIA